MKSQKALKIFNLRLGSKSVAPLNSMRRIHLAWFKVDRRWSINHHLVIAGKRRE